MRGVLSSLLIVAALRWLGHWRLPVPCTNRQLIAIRSLSEIVARCFFLTALFNMPLANVIALLQMLPLTVTLALCKPVGQRRMVANMIGFCGMLLIVRPGTSGCNVY